MTKKKKKSTGKKRGRRVGAIRLKKPSGDTLQLVGGVIISNVGGRFITQFAKKTFPSVKPAIMDWAMAIGQGVGGYVLATNTKNAFFKGAGIGFMAAGTGQMLSNVGVKLSGIPVMIPMRGNNTMVGKLGYGNTANGGYPQPARVGNAANTFPQPGRVGRMNKVAYAAAAM